MEKYSEAKIHENKSAPRNDSVKSHLQQKYSNQSHGVSHDCKYVLADIRASSSLE